MNYTSTRNRAVQVTAAQAITQGISADGGLFVPQTLPAVSADQLSAWASLPYAQRANEVLSLFLTDFTVQEIDACTNAAYTAGRFRTPAIAPLHSVDETTHILELWHGPTCAFKDMALQILPHLMRVSAGKTADGKEIVILVATSGDTGKAALEGFRDAAHTRILVFYPVDGVSPMQKLQMTTQEGKNVGVCAIRGNFDDAQSGVKAIFTDPAMAAELAEHNMAFSSANSINWGRLVPQIVYYFSAYCDLIRDGKIKNGDVINVAVPTGNFGNILAAYYAKRMGLPIKTMICASNTNNVLTDFITTGTYDRNRAFYTTSSPSMDILISSNLERLLYDLSGQDDAAVRGWMEQLKNEGRYTVSPEVLAKLQQEFAAGWCDDAKAGEAIVSLMKKDHYLCDPHTAVAVNVTEEYRRKTGDATPVVIASTANPYKFCASVLNALGDSRMENDEFAKMAELEALSGCAIPAPLAELRGKAPRFTQVTDRENMRAAVRQMLY